MPANEILFQNLDINTQEILNLTENLTPAQLLLHPENKWSIIQILEHIILTDRIVIRLLSKKSESHSDTTEIHGHERLHRMIVTMRSRLVNAPDMLQPKGDIQTLEAFKQVFTEQRLLLKSDIADGKITIDNRIEKHPYLGEMTMSDWMHFMPLHAKRHLEQIRDILNSNTA